MKWALFMVHVLKSVSTRGDLLEGKVATRGPCRAGVIEPSVWRVPVFLRPVQDVCHRCVLYSPMNIVNRSDEKQN